MMPVDEEELQESIIWLRPEPKKYGENLPDGKTQRDILLKQIPILMAQCWQMQELDLIDKPIYPVINFYLNGEGAKIFGDFLR